MFRYVAGSVSQSMGNTDLREKERYTGKNDSERGRDGAACIHGNGTGPWCFLEKCMMIARKGKWIPCGVYLFVAVAPFFRKPLLKCTRVCLCSYVCGCGGGLGFDFESMCSLFPLSVRGSLWHKSTYTFMPLFPLQSLKSRRELTKSKLLPKAIKEMFLISQYGGAMEQPEPTKNNE